MAGLRSHFSLPAPTPPAKRETLDCFNLKTSVNSLLSAKKDDDDEKNSKNDLLLPFKKGVITGRPPVGIDAENKNPIKEKLKNPNWTMPAPAYSPQSHFVSNIFDQQSTGFLQNATHFLQSAFFDSTLHEEEKSSSNSDAKQLSAQSVVSYLPYIVGGAALAYGLAKVTGLSKVLKVFSEAKPLQRLASYASKEINQKLDSAAVKIFGGDGMLDGLIKQTHALPNVSLIMPPPFKSGALLMIENHEKNMKALATTLTNPAIISSQTGKTIVSYMNVKIDDEIAEIALDAERRIHINGKAIDDIITDDEITRLGEKFDTRHPKPPSRIVYENNFQIYKANIALAEMRYKKTLNKAMSLSDKRFIEEIQKNHSTAIGGYDTYGFSRSYGGSLRCQNATVKYGIVATPDAIEVIEDLRRAGKLNGLNAPVRRTLAQQQQERIGLHRLENIVSYNVDENNFLTYETTNRNFDKHYVAMNAAHKEVVAALKSGNFEDIIRKSGLYYQQAIVAMPFHRGSNSLFMMQVNAHLKAAGLRPIMHGELDAVANLLSAHDFESHFSKFVARQQPLYFKAGQHDLEVLVKPSGQITIDGKKVDDIVSNTDIMRDGKKFDNINIPGNPNGAYQNDARRFGIYKANAALARVIYQKTLPDFLNASDVEFLSSIKNLHKQSIHGIKNYRVGLDEYASELANYTVPVNYGVLKEKSSIQVIEKLKAQSLRESDRYFEGCNFLDGIRKPVNYGIYKSEPYLIYGAEKTSLEEYLPLINEAHKRAVRVSILNLQEKSLPAIARYYQYAIASHMFPAGNNSLFMNQVNYMLKKSGLKPVMHGELDAMANILSQKDFEKHFSEYVLKRQN